VLDINQLADTEVSKAYCLVWMSVVGKLDCSVSLSSSPSATIVVNAKGEIVIYRCINLTTHIKQISKAEISQTIESSRDLINSTWNW
jgi:hypothetical protein